MIIHAFGIVPLCQEGMEWKVLLILHKMGNHWGFPKGRAESNEESLQSAIRELKEETGLDVLRVLTPTPFIEQYQFTRKHQRVSKIVSYYAAIVSGDLQLQEEEIRDARWLNFADAMEQLTFKEARSIFKKVERELSLK